jgi:hypothetical protein
MVFDSVTNSVDKGVVVLDDILFLATKHVKSPDLIPRYWEFRGFLGGGQQLIVGKNPFIGVR